MAKEVVRISYNKGHVRTYREIFMSYPGQVTVIKAWDDKQGCIPVETKLKAISKMKQ